MPKANAVTIPPLMDGRPLWLQERQWPEIEQYLRRDDLVLLPVGSTEQHGPHLPVGTDTAEAIAVALGAAERLDLLVAPPVWYGWTAHHMGYPGTITLRAETLTAIVEDVCQSLVYHGFKRIVIVNGHRVANLPPLEIAVVKARNKTGASIAVFDLALSARRELRELFSGAPGAVGHACEDETSQMLWSYPELVAVDEIQPATAHASGKYAFGGFNIADPARDVDFVFRPPTVDEYRRSSAATKGVNGDPSRASRELGERIFEVLVTNLCEVVELARAHEVELRSLDIPL
jgi:creatinine amidohydrolase